MDRRVSATEANQRFSELLRDVENGERVVITSRGRPVARFSPFADEDDAEAREDRAKRVRRSLEFVRTLPRMTVKPWTREELYER